MSFLSTSYALFKFTESLCPELILTPLLSGAFLIPYVFMMVFTGFPLMFLELSFGQYGRLGIVSIWRKACPLFEGMSKSNVCFLLKAWSTTDAQPVETTTILNAQPFWMPLEMNTLWCFLECSWLVFYWTLAALGKAKYQYRPLRASRKNMTLTSEFDPDLRIWPWPLTLTSGLTLTLITSEKIQKPLLYDLELWPTTLTYNPSLA